MASIRRYTHAQLLFLRDSPLVQKPDDLPAIEQWLEYVYEGPESREKLRIHHSEPNANSGRQPRQQQGGKNGAGSGMGGAESPMGAFSAGVRPGLVGRGLSSRGGDDVSLGPPKTMFPSSRNVAKLSDFSSERNEGGEEVEGGKSRLFGDRGNRKSGQEKDAWTMVKERRQAGEEAQKQDSRYTRRDREQDSERRNGTGEKYESRWPGDRRQNGDRPTWRDREREKGRGWDRDQHTEKEPEWMDAGADDDTFGMGMPRNQEDFQRWKEAMSGKKAPAPEPEPQPEPQKTAPLAKATEPLKLDGILDTPFGGWGDPKAASAGTLDGAAASVKAAQSKAKASRFASMFKDTQIKEEEPPPPETKAAGGANGNAENEAGFNRILKMLGGSVISESAPQPQAQPPQQQADILSSPPSSKAGMNGMKQKSRFTGFFDQTPKSPERMQSPPDAPFGTNGNDRFQPQRGFNDESSAMLEGRSRENQRSEPFVQDQVRSNPMSPELMQTPPANRDQQQQGLPHQRMQDIFLDQPPSRTTASPDVNIQNLLASQRAQRSQGQEKNSAFLLDLLQTKGARPPSQQPRQEGHFNLWLEQPSNISEPHAPKPRTHAPPCLLEEQLLRNTPQEQEMTRNDVPQHQPAQRAPPGFYGEPNLYLHQQQQQQLPQRRPYDQPPPPPQQQQFQQGPRRMSGHPQQPLQMQIPNQHYPQHPSEFLTSPISNPPLQSAGPPPGFHPQMPRHPPGLHNTPNIFQPPQQAQQPPQQQLPPGFAQGGMQSPPNAGFFAGPPGGYGGPGPGQGVMGMRSPVEGMRGRFDFDGYGPQARGR